MNHADYTKLAVGLQQPVQNNVIAFHHAALSAAMLADPPLFSGGTVESMKMTRSVSKIRFKAFALKTRQTV